MASDRIELLKELYKKIQNGTATEQEKFKFDMGVATHSMANEQLLEIIREETK